MGPPHLPGLICWDQTPGQDSAVGGWRLTLASCRHLSPFARNAKLDVIGITRVGPVNPGFSMLKQANSQLSAHVRPCFLCVTKGMQTVKKELRRPEMDRRSSEHQQVPSDYFLFCLSPAAFHVSGPTTPSTIFR